jgi:hypothetical protein
MRYVFSVSIPNQTIKGETMSILSMSPELHTFCEKHNLYEYGTTYVITMPNGFRFTTQDSNIAHSFEVSADTKGAIVETIVELGE